MGIYARERSPTWTREIPGIRETQENLQGLPEIQGRRESQEEQRMSLGRAAAMTCRLQTVAGLKVDLENPLDQKKKESHVPNKHGGTKTYRTIVKFGSYGTAPRQPLVGVEAPRSTEVNETVRSLRDLCRRLNQSRKVHRSTRIVRD
jgi:hypothetical protein